MNVQVIADPFGDLVWASPALPGAVHDIRAVRTHGIIDTLTQSDIPCWADRAYQGAGGTVRVPYRGRWENLSAGQQAVNRSHARIRALGEQAMATLKTWRLLRKLRCSTTRITDLVKAVLSLHLTINMRLEKPHWHCLGVEGAAGPAGVGLVRTPGLAGGPAVVRVSCDHPVGGPVRPGRSGDRWAGGVLRVIGRRHVVLSAALGPVCPAHPAGRRSLPSEKRNIPTWSPSRAGQV
jgi:hypothetical protein